MLNHLAVRTGISYNCLRDIVSRKLDPYEDLVLARHNGRKMRRRLSGLANNANASHRLPHRIVPSASAAR